MLILSKMVTNSTVTGDATTVAPRAPGAKEQNPGEA